MGLNDFLLSFQRCLAVLGKGDEIFCTFKGTL